MSTTSGGVLKRCPVEVWGRILTSVLEDGASGSSLPLVSKFFRDVSHPARIHSPFISFDIHDLHPLENLLLYLTGQRERHIRHLFVNIFNSEFDIHRPTANRRRGDIFSQKISLTLNKIFEILDPSLTTLTLYLGPGTTPPQIRVELPLLQELNIFLCPHQLPRPDEPRFFHATSLIPALKRLNIAYAGDTWEEQIAGDIFDDIHEYAPSLTHLRVVAPNAILPPPAVFVHPFGLADAIQRLGHRVYPPECGIDLLKSLRHAIIKFVVYKRHVAPRKPLVVMAPRTDGEVVPRRTFAQKSPFRGPPPVTWEDIRRVMDSSEVKIDLVDGTLDCGPGVIPFGLAHEKELWRERSQGGQGWWAVEDETPFMDGRWAVEGGDDIEDIDDMDDIDDYDDYDEGEDEGEDGDGDGDD